MLANIILAVGINNRNTRFHTVSELASDLWKCCGVALPGVTVSFMGISHAQYSNNSIQNFATYFNAMLRDTVPQGHFVAPLPVPEVKMASTHINDIHYSTETASALTSRMIDHIQQFRNLN